MKVLRESVKLQVLNRNIHFVTRLGRRRWSPAIFSEIVCAKLSEFAYYSR
jgi:hypothetical protein